MANRDDYIKILPEPEPLDAEPDMRLDDAGGELDVFGWGEHVEFMLADDIKRWRLKA